MEPSKVTVGKEQELLWHEGVTWETEETQISRERFSSLLIVVPKVFWVWPCVAVLQVDVALVLATVLLLAFGSSTMPK